MIPLIRELILRIIQIESSGQNVAQSLEFSITTARFKSDFLLTRASPDSLVDKDEALSRPKPGFKSRSGHQPFGNNTETFLK